MNLTFLLMLAWSTFPVALSQSAGDTYQLATLSLERIQTLTENLTEGIQNWDGSDLTTALSDIHMPAEGLVDYIKNATESMQSQDTTFSLNQAFRIASPTQRLAYAVNASIATLNRRLDNFESAQISAIVVTDLQSLLNATRDFADGLIRHVPTNLRPVAVNMKAQNIDSLQQGIDCFGGTDSACSTAIVDPNRTYELAIRYDAMKRDGSPIA
jgi:hypothetical protein